MSSTVSKLYDLAPFDDGGDVLGKHLSDRTSVYLLVKEFDGLVVKFGSGMPFVSSAVTSEGYMQCRI